ncbi:hypothetical protein ACMFMF_011681 [Clarireedia jacksonii]
MVSESSLSPDVEKLITDPEVLRVLRLFIALGRTDIIKFLNETIDEDAKEVQNTLEALHFFVKRGLRTQRYLTEQMRSGREPSDWPYDPDEEESFSSAETHLVNKYKFGARWPTVRGAIDVFRRGLLNCIDKMEWEDPVTRLKYRAWTTVNICPPDRRLWDRNSTAYKSQRFCAYSRLQVVIFYPGLVNLAFLEQAQADVLKRAEAHFNRHWARSERFRKKAVKVTRRVLERYGSVDDGYTNYDGLLTKEALVEKRKVILADFDAQYDAMLGAGVEDFREFSHAGWWYKYGSFWSPGNSIGSILHSNIMLAGKKFRENCNKANDSKEVRTEVATRAVSRFGYASTLSRHSSTTSQRRPKNSHRHAHDGTSDAKVTPHDTAKGKGIEGGDQHKRREHRNRERSPTTENHNRNKAGTKTGTSSERTKKTSAAMFG